MEGTLSVHASGWITYAFESCRVDQSVGSESTWRLDPKTVTGRNSFAVHVFEKQSSASSATEVPDGTVVNVCQINEKGARDNFIQPQSYDRSTGYEANEAVVGSDCIVAIVAIPPGASGLSAFNVVKKNINLSTATILDFTQNIEPATTLQISVTGTVGATQGQLVLVTPNGPLVASAFEFDADGKAEIAVSNPYGYNGYWTQMKFGFVDGHSALSMSTSLPAPLSDAITLPALPSIMPTAYPNPASIQYAAGTLSVDPAAGTNGYRFDLETTTGELLANIISVGQSMVLPAWLQSQLAGQTIRVTVTPTDADDNWSWSPPDLSLAVSDSGVVPGTGIVLVMPDGSDYKDIVF